MFFWKLALGLASLAVLGLIYSFFEASRLSCRFLSLPLAQNLDSLHNQRAVKLCSVPTKSPSTLRLFFLSDVHVGSSLPSYKKVASFLRDSQADLMIIGGDLYSHQRHKAKGLTYLRNLDQLAQTLGTSILLIQGNHDEGLAPAELLEFKTLTYLYNDEVQIEFKERLISFLGLADCRLGRPHPQEAIQKTLKVLTHKPTDATVMRERRHPNYRFLLSHNPDQVLSTKLPYDLMLSGHYHGGQIRLPFRLEFKWLRKKDQLAKEGYYTGLNTHPKGRVYISNGVGTVLFPLRFLASSDCLLIDLDCEQI